MPENDSSAFVDYYELLSVDTDAPVRSIRAQYLKLAKDAHPDIGGSNDAMQMLNRAYKTLANPTARAAYDLMHSAHLGKSSQSYQYIEAPSSGNLADDDEYIDMFLDQVYREYSADKVMKKPKSRKDLLNRLFGC